MSREDEIRQWIESTAAEHGFARVGNNGTADIFKQVVTGQEVLVCQEFGLNQKTAAMYIHKFRQASVRGVKPDVTQEEPKCESYLDEAGWPIGFNEL